MKKLLIIGHGGLGRCTKDIALRTKSFSSIKFLDDISEDIEVIGKLSELDKFIDSFDHVFVAIGNNRVRKELMEKIAEEKLISIIDPNAFVSSDADLAKGLLIYPGVVVESKAKINKGSIISSYTIISHDSCIGAYNLIYAGTVIRPKVITNDLIKIGNNCVIGDGVRVIEDVGDLCIQSVLKD